MALLGAMTFAGFLVSVGFYGIYAEKREARRRREQQEQQSPTPPPAHH